jgi:hypothetical protein
VARHRAVTLGASLGLLQTQYHGFVQNGVLLPDRELANAPHWQGAVNLTYRDPRGAFARIDVTGMGSYYFDLPPNWTTSHAYGLLNAKLGWETARGRRICGDAISSTRTTRCADSTSATYRPTFRTSCTCSSETRASGASI